MVDNNNYEFLIQNAEFRLQDLCESIDGWENRLDIYI